MTGFASLAMVNLECADPAAMTDFYHQVLGWDITYQDENYGMVSGNGTSIGFGKVADYTPPTWPDAKDSPKRYHLDLYVDDLDEAQEHCMELGAVKPEFQPQPDRWRVMTDPSGQPFCLCVKQNA
jgi:predicted enzyme related to lactoylglutathione lyase